MPMSAHKRGPEKESSEWNRLGSVFYERRELYSWSVEIGSGRVQSAGNGGPVAVVPDTNDLQQVWQVQNIAVYNSAGHQLSSIVYEGASGLLGFGWTSKQLLVCVHRDGRVLQHDVHGRVVYDSYIFSSALQGQSAERCVIWSDGIAVLTSLNQLLVVLLKDATPRVQHFVTGPLTDEVQALEVNQPFNATQETLELILASGKSILIADSKSCRAQEIFRGEPIMLKISPNGQFLAIFTTTGKVLVVAMDFSKIIYDFDTKSSVPPEQLAWCGADAVVLYWPEIMLLVGPFGDWIKYSYENPAKFTSERDGLRVVTSRRHEFIFRVHCALVDIFSIGSTTPAALLRVATEHFDIGLAKAETFLKLIGANIPLAVIGCIRAACNDTNSKRQVGLLRAAYFGLSFLKSKTIIFNPWVLCKACTLLRILNAVHSADIGVPLTYAQYCHIGLRALVKRLIDMHHHLLAARILSMGLPKMCSARACKEFCNIGQHQRYKCQMISLILLF
mmetsp:Transcript_4418/g.10762  ORF Transcript_4418/g.10762 Transcript_4418/m.10762 type:complete len:504 (-) Transcript_4418:1880-3391(-)